MDLSLEGRTAVVTGGASNIGRSISRYLAEGGASVVIIDRDEDQATRTAELCGERTSVLVADLSDLAQVNDVGQRLVTGHESIDILVNNAGWVNTLPYLEKELDELHLEVRLNLLAPMLLTKILVPGMVNKGWGRVVSVASEAGRVGQRGQVAYAAAKSGVMGMTRALSHEVGRHGVTVNAVSPAMTVPRSADEIGEGSMQQTRNRPPELMDKIIKSYPVGRVGTPDDIAAAVAFLCSEQAGFITGQTLPVNGGFVTT
ncbi:SDR family NAD(P)-dependent oxidoreductase [Streptosporangium sp. NPDC087985]|uniref:SDR family NAD(P)-dependent oxidoreductase n=1 Tax=Streptosporangium sp. NPDC087985 TaxID=3366196 RepID=UPI00382BDFCC